MKLSIPTFISSRKLWADSFWTLFGNVVGVIVGLATIKVVTKIVSADDYGKASLVLGIVGLLGNIFGVPLMSAHLRTYFDYLERGMGRWFARKFYRVLAIVCGVSLLTYLLIASLSYANGVKIYWSLLLPAFGVIVSNFYLSTNTNYLEAHWLFRRLAAINTLSRILYLLVVVLLLQTSMAVTSSLVFAQAIPGFLLPLVFHADKSKLPEEEKVSRDETFGHLKSAFTGFGWSLPLGSIGQWVLSTGDRYVIEHFLTPRDVGMYVVNYGLWSIPYTVLNGWLEVLTKSRVYSKAAQMNWRGVKQILQMRLVIGMALSFIGLLCFLLIGERIGSALLGSDYRTGKALMMSIAAAHCFYVTGASVMPLFIATKRTQISLIAVVIAAVSNIAIDLFIVPTYGILGAGISILIAYIIWASVIILSGYLILRNLIRRNSP